MLPVFFFATAWAQSSERPSDRYRVFYLSLSEFSKWASADRADRSKDLFMARHRLPLKGRQATVVPVSARGAFGENALMYFPLHVEFVSKRTVVFSWEGVEKGYLAINGERKGSFDLRGSRGYVEVSVSFDPGVYALMFVCEKRYADLPVTLIADQPLTVASRGFTKSFSASVSLKVREVVAAELYDQLWRTQCVPAPRDEARFDEAWRQVSTGDPADATPSFDEKKTPLVILLKYSRDERARSLLLKAGFTEDMLEWWRNRLSEPMACIEQEVQ